VTAIDSPASTRTSKVSLNLLGGGVTGAFFHFGVLAALDDHLSRKSVNFDCFMGTSAGSLVATVCAVGLSPQVAVEEILTEKRGSFQMHRKDIYRFSIVDWTKEILKFWWTLFYLTYMRIENPAEAPSFFWGLKDSLPAGLFSMRYYETWIRRTFENNKMPLFFTELQRQLFIPAFDLDSNQRIVFGKAPFQHIPFYKAIAASSTIPMFFEPTEIEGRYYVDGGLGELAHLDITASEGAQLIILVNPMVPIRNDLESVQIRTVFESKGRIRDKGLTYVFDQCLRNEIRQKVHISLRHLSYLYPGVDVLLIEPDETDTKMFLFNPMDFEARKQIVQIGYETTQKKLKDNAELWKRTLDRHEITLVGV
jgi:NTE family protein